MFRDGLNKIFWGFIFILLDFKIQGFDILPDVVGYILFAMGFGILASSNEYFQKAKNFNIPLIILSIFSIYERPSQTSGGVQLGTLGIFGVIIGIAAIVLNLLVIYNMFMGIKNEADQQGKFDLSTEAEKRWKQYLTLQIAVFFSFILIFIPPLAIIFIIGLAIVSIVLTVAIMGFIKRCSESL